jgi:hypothetical protein
MRKSFQALTPVDLMVKITSDRDLGVVTTRLPTEVYHATADKPRKRDHMSESTLDNGD